MKTVRCPVVNDWCPGNADGILCAQPCTDAEVPFMKTPGQAAYEEWRRRAQAQVDFAVSTWEQIGETSQGIWEEIAKAAIEKYKRLNVTVPGEERQ